MDTQESKPELDLLDGINSAPRKITAITGLLTVLDETEELHPETLSQVGMMIVPELVTIRREAEKLYRLTVEYKPQPA